MPSLRGHVAHLDRRLTPELLLEVRVVVEDVRGDELLVHGKDIRGREARGVESGPARGQGDGGEAEEDVVVGGGGGGGGAGGLAQEKSLGGGGVVDPPPRAPHGLGGSLGV